MEHRRYMHIERFGTDEVDGIEIGETLIFPKADGTQSQAYLGNDGEVRAGSKNRELTLDNDNGGFYAYVLTQPNIKAYLQKHPTHRLLGEFLIPHTLKTYRDDAWRRFWIFDVAIDREDGGLEYIPYDIYKPLLEEFNLDYLPPLARIRNGSYDNFIHVLNNNNFLIKDGCGNGEGIVCKNYSFRNRYGRTTWAKIVTSEFKEKHHKAMGEPTIDAGDAVEFKIAEDFVTSAFVEKEFAKIVHEEGGWKSQLIPRLLSTVYHELITEEMWNILKKYKNPKIDFKMLNSVVINKIKQVKKEIFN